VQNNSLSNASISEVNPALAEAEADVIDKVELARILKSTVPTIEYWTRSKKIPHFRIGHRTVRYSLSEVRRALLRKMVKEV
jgi:hypothetical protein